MIQSHTIIGNMLVLYPIDCDVLVPKGSLLTVNTKR